MPVLLYDVPTTTPYSQRLIDLGIVANYETLATIKRLLDHIGRYLPDTRGVNAAEADWFQQIAADRVLNYTYGFGLLRDSVWPTLMLEAMGADYVGAQPDGLYLSANKPHMAALVAASGFDVPTECLIARDVTGHRAEDISKYFAAEWLVIKPAYEESSLGLSVVQNEPAEIVSAVASLRKAVKGVLLAQEYIDGLDVTVPVIGRGSPSCLPAVVLQHDVKQTAPFVLDAERKATKSHVQYQSMATWSIDIRRQLYDMALTAFRLAHLRDYARLDCRITDAGQCYFLEINANPQLGLEKASFAVSAAQIGMEIGQVIRQMVSYEDLPYGPTPLGLGC